MKQISLDDYNNNPNILKGFGIKHQTKEELKKSFKHAEERLEENFAKGLIDEIQFNKASYFLDLLKGEPSRVGQLHPVHIVDKNGKHTIVWKKQQHIEKEGHNKVGVGHGVKMRSGKKGVITKVHGYKDHGKSRGYTVRLKHEDGKVSDKYVHNLELTGKKHDVEPVKPVGRPKNGEMDKKEGGYQKYRDLIAKIDFSDTYLGRAALRIRKPRTMQYSKAEFNQKVKNLVEKYGKGLKMPEKKLLKEAITLLSQDNIGKKNVPAQEFFGHTKKESPKKESKINTTTGKFTDDEISSVKSKISGLGRLDSQSKHDNDHELGLLFIPTRGRRLENLTGEEIAAQEKKYRKLYEPKVEKVIKELKKDYKNAQYYIGVGEKGHVEIDIILRKRKK